jgi:hypothetical protein
MDTQNGKRQAERENPTPPPILKTAKTTSGRFPRPVKGLAKSKPKGGAPLGNRNALKTGRHTAQMRALREEVRSILSGTQTLLRNFDVASRAKA